MTMRKGTRREGEETPVGSRRAEGEVIDPFLGIEDNLMKEGMTAEITTDLRTNKEHLRGIPDRVQVTDTETITEIKRGTKETQGEIKRETDTEIGVMIGSGTMTETGKKEMGLTQMRTGEAGASQGTTGRDTITSTPGIAQGRITDQHTTERVAGIGEILDQGREKQEEVVETAGIDTPKKQAYHYTKRIWQEWSSHQSTKWT